MKAIIGFWVVFALFAAFVVGCRVMS